MPDRERLPELSAVNRSADDFVKKIVSIVVKAFYVRAGQEQDRVLWTAQIEVGCASSVHFAKVTECDCRPRSFSLIGNSLHSEGDSSRAISSLLLNAGTGKRLRCG